MTHKDTTLSFGKVAVRFCKLGMKTTLSWSILSGHEINKPWAVVRKDISAGRPHGHNSAMMMLMLENDRSVLGDAQLDIWFLSRLIPISIVVKRESAFQGKNRHPQQP